MKTKRTIYEVIVGLGIFALLIIGFTLCTAPDKKTPLNDTVAEKEPELPKESKSEAINKAMADMNQSDLAELHTSVLGITTEIKIFKAWAKIANAAENDKYSKEVLPKFRKKVMATQKKEFPLLREAYTELVKNKVWEDDMEVTSYGPAYDRIWLTGAAFARHAYIKLIHETMIDIFTDLRFSTVTYKYSNYDSDPTSFRISCPEDEVMTE
jgi:hypothetical protein